MNTKNFKRSGLGMRLINSVGSTKYYENSDKLEQDIKFRLLTPQYGILGSPQYGSNIRDYLYRFNSLDTLELITSEVYDIISEYDGVEVTNIYSEQVDEKLYITYSATYDTENIDNTILVSQEELVR